jgi:hypothetical protein
MLEIPLLIGLLAENTFIVAIYFQSAASDAGNHLLTKLYYRHIRNRLNLVILMSQKTLKGAAKNKKRSFGRVSDLTESKTGTDGDICTAFSSLTFSMPISLLHVSLISPLRSLDMN